MFQLLGNLQGTIYNSQSFRPSLPCRTLPCVVFTTTIFVIIINVVVIFVNFIGIFITIISYHILFIITGCSRRLKSAHSLGQQAPLSNIKMNNTTQDILIESAEDLNQRFADHMTIVIALLAFLAPVGTIGNITVLIVYSTSKTYKDTNYKTFVIWLAVVDLLACVTIIPAEITSLKMVYTFRNKIFCKLKCFSMVYSNTVTGLAFVVIALERYRKICHPFSRQINRGLATKIVIFVIVFALILCIPAPIMCGISREDKVNIYNTITKVDMCEVEERFERTVIRMIYKSIFTVLLIFTSMANIVMYGLVLRTTCIVRRRLISQNREFESIRLSNRNMNILNESDELLHEKSKGVLPRTTQNGTRAEVHHDEIYEKGSDIQVDQTASRVASNGDQKVYSNLHRLDMRDAKNIQDTAKRKQCIPDCGLSRKTLIWLILTIVFITTYFLYTILAYYTTTQYRMSPQELMFYKFLMRIFFVNNVINPIIYACLDTKFRSSCRDIYANFKSRCRSCFK